MENLKKLVKDTLYQEDIQIDDLPALDLYIDQLLMLIENKSEDKKRQKSDKILTKTMINNYSKEGLIFPAKGKKYTQEHILQILMILSMKNTLSLTDIKMVMQNVTQREDYSTESLKMCYNTYLSLKNHARDSVIEVIENVVDLYDIQPDDKNKLLLLILCFTSMADEMKRLSELMIDCYFKDEEKK